MQITLEPVLDMPLAELAVPLQQLEPQPRTVDRTASARLLEYERGRWVALPVHTTIEVLDSPRTVEVPGAAYYCCSLIKWRQQWLPVLNLQALVHAHPLDKAQQQPQHVLIVAYQLAAFKPLHYGALHLPFFPETVEVADSAQCPLPVDSDLWSLIASSCFKHDGHVVPVLDTARLFGSYHG
jgi:hypothetical protein